MPLSCCVTLSRSPSPSGLQILSHFLSKPANALRAGTGSYRVSYTQSLTQSQEPHKQPTLCTHSAPSSPGICDQREGHSGVWAGAGGGGLEGVPGTSSPSLSDPLSKAFKQSFIQQTFVETQDKGSLGPRSMVRLDVPRGRTGRIWLIHRRLGRRPWGGRTFPGSSRPAH